MTAAAKGAATRKGGGSRAAKAQKTAKFAGVTLKLPPELPATFAFDFAQITAREEAGENASAGTYRLIVGVIGEEQYTQVRDAIAEGKGKGKTLVDLVGEVVSAYGTGPGE